jgi:copper(I)-binding protein
MTSNCFWNKIVRKNMFGMMSSALAVLLSLGYLVMGCDSSSRQPVITIENVWSRPVIVSTDSGSMQNSGYNGAVYLTIKNSGGASDRLTKAKTDVCLITEIHESFIKDDRMMMERVNNGIEIPAGGRADLKPGSYHIMLMGVKRSLSEGDSFAVQLNFEKSGIRTVYAKIKKF